MTSSQNNTGKYGSEEPTPPPSEPYFLIFGKIARPHGVRGELKMEVRTNDLELLTERETVYLGQDPDDPDSARLYQLLKTRLHKGQLLLILEGINDRNAADLLRGQLVMIPYNELAPLDEDEYYIFQLIGLPVYTAAGEHLGEVINIIETGANDVFVVSGGQRGDLLIPDTEEVIQDIDIAGGRVTITPIPGLFSDDE